MKEKMNQKGFIQIPILIAIIIGVFVVGGAGYVGAKQYQAYQAEKPIIIKGTFPILSDKLYGSQ